ncbi:MAG: hypothetical protein EWM47_02195 [Anaerolineaceae bacterium]|nr:MAG: hypothetical protein EWM47_02195 [Anaerolineaceae bacterium]
MSFEPKKRNEIEMDKFNIKSHLNRSLEAEGISVSEDLISRTMDAIKLQEAKDLDKNKDNNKDNLVYKKPIFIYRHARTLVTVAAAVLILVVGINAIRMFAPLGMKKDMAKSENSASYDDAGTTEIYQTKNAPKEDSGVPDMDTSDGLQSDTKFTGGIAEDDSADLVENEQFVDMFVESKSEDHAEISSADNDRLTSLGEELTFVDITFIEATDVNQITITSKTTGEIKTISNQEQIDNFYVVMEKHGFRPGTEDDIAAQYVIMLNSDERDSQIIIGETAITVDHTYKDMSSQSVYISTDHNMLINDLNYLLTK